MEIKTAKLEENGVLINGSLHLPDSNTGHIRESYNLWLSKGNTPNPEFTAKEIINNAQASAILNVKAFASQCRQLIAGNPDHLETAEWSEKRLRSLRISNDQALPGDIDKIETEALYREQNETVGQLVTKILAKANRFEHASIVITGMTAAAIAKVNKANSPDEIETLYISLKDKANTELANL